MCCLFFREVGLSLPLRTSACVCLSGVLVVAGRLLHSLGLSSLVRVAAMARLQWSLQTLRRGPAAAEGADSEAGPPGALMALSGGGDLRCKALQLLLSYHWVSLLSECQSAQGIGLRDVLVTWSQMLPCLG